MARPRWDVIASWGIAGIFFATLAALVALGRLPLLIPIVYAVLSVLTFGAYGLDKASATQGAQRVPEFSLHTLELLGGWPGAVVAQWHYRHKNRKLAYQVVYWLLVLCNLGALILFCVGLERR